MREVAICQPDRLQTLGTEDKVFKLNADREKNS